MAPSAKGKEKVIDGGMGSSGKRKRNNGGNVDDNTGGRKRKNRGVLQFFEDAAYEVDEDDSSDESFFDDDFLEDEFDMPAAATKFQNEPSRPAFTPLVPKEEEPTEEELERMLQERYKPGSTFVTYAEDNYESKRAVERPEYYPSVKDPIIWKVKCMVGRERHSAFCLMQKFVDLHFLGMKLQIISAFALDHIKGFIYIEAEKQADIYEACNGLCSIYSSRVAPVPKDDISHLFSLRSKGGGISEGMWARVKNGKYKGDLAQVVAVNYVRKKVTVKLIPRIDLQALAEKFGRGITANRAVNPAPRLISSSELEEFRPLIQYRRDRDTNKFFEILDGMMLKDGYLYKKASIDSLSFWGVTPTADELLKFEPSKNDECNDLEWLSQLYGSERKKKHPLVCDKGGGKGEGSSSSILHNNFEVHDLVFFGRKDFGVVIGTEKDESFKIIKEGSEGPVVVNVPQRELKNASFDKKLFTALDQQKKMISINDTVRVVHGPLEGREGTVKRIYRGIIFLYNEIVEENTGYICCKAQMCEKVELPGEACNEKGGEPGPSVFGDFASSPKSPLSPKQSDQGRDGSRNFNREDNAMFSVGQSLRIRVGPLKGYLCRVLAIRRSDVTVKLDSQHKILTVKCEHLAEVRARSSGISLGEDSDSVKPFDLLGTQDGSTDWLEGTAKAAEGGNWNTEGFSTERSSWNAFPASNFSTEPQSSNSFKSVDEDAKKGDSSWEAKPAPSQNSSWGAAAAAQETADGGQVAGWGNQVDSSKKGAFGTGFGSCASDSWGKAVESTHQPNGEGLKEDSWGRAGGNLSIKDDSSGSKSAWNASGVASEKPTDANAWNKVTTSSEHQTESLGTLRKDGECAGAWGKNAQASAWNQSTGVADGGSSWNKQDGGSSGNKQDGGSSWSKPDGGSSSWSKPDGGSSSWSKPDGGSSSRSKPDGGSSSWIKPDGGSSSWSKSVGAMEKKGDTDQGGSWGRTEPFDGGRGSGGRRGRGSGRGERGQFGRGRGQFGRGRSVGQGESSNSVKGDTDDDGFGGETFKGNNFSWNSGGKNMSFTGGKEDGWGKPNASGDSDGSKWNKGWRANNETGDRGLAGNESSDWQNKGNFNASKSSDGNCSSGWNKKSLSTEQKSESKGQDDAWNKGGVSTADQVPSWSKGTSDSVRPVDGEGSWEKRETLVENSKSPWKTSTTSLDGNQSSARGSKSNWNTQKGSLDKTSSWGQKSNDSKMDVEADNGGAWNTKKTSDGSSTSGWGQSKSAGATDAGGGSLDKTSSWGQKFEDSKMDVEADKGGAWNSNKASDGGSTLGWGQGKWGGATDAGGGSQDKTSSWGQKSDNSMMDVESDKGGAWNSKKTLDGGSTSGWGQSKWGGATDAGGGSLDKTSSWGQKSDDSKMDVESDKGGAWNSKKTVGGGSTSGWGKSKWGGATDGGGGSSSGWGQSKWGEETNAGVKQNSWGSKSNWNSDNNFGSNEEENGTFGDKGRGGNWRGGRGGRWGQDRGGFGGRGGSERGDFRGRGESDRGGFGGRGRSDRGGFGGRGRSGRGDSGDFGGRGGSDRGGFRGRGRGRRDDWDKKDSGEDKPYSWSNTSDKQVDWKSNSGRGNLNDGVHDKDQWQSGSSGWGAAGGRDSARAGGWKKGSNDGGGSDAQASDWRSGRGAAGGGDSSRAGGWNKGSNNADGSDAQATGWNREESDWKAKDVGSGDKPNSWKNGSNSNAEDWASNNSGGNWQGGVKNQWQGSGSDWKKSKEPAEEINNVGGSDAKTSGWDSQDNNWKTSNSSGGATSSSWNQPATGQGEGAGSADAWGKAAASSWAQAKDGNDKGGW
ncbi:hypothetical protein ACH5RR_018919 [Cinchona calisaya]|uniref:Protein RNA-directed DNA methylation 3 n=1 Tax=Cinchona calisaya TaxID=153742 RepID=A0ABD2ZRF9_9GENT